ncbi:glutathione S-transferase Mu 4-like [Leopardus geoffroyi]|uniref:glutathione S-transferase Mu 4-like n=1 Tax=Leopardus geoffroyi TaxID=46844 RepID=UPI001E261473|nr:glutathione S-transferase Mu 4-like [Leopardus geoffroyi]
MILGYWDIRGKVPTPGRLQLSHYPPFSNYLQQRKAGCQDFSDVFLGFPSQRAHAIRLLLADTDSHYQGKMYTMGDALDYDRSQWLDEKFKLGLDFPNLPYLIDGAHNIILCYIARKHNLCKWDRREMIHVDILENQAMDASNQLTRVCYSPDFERLKPAYLESIPGEMKLYSQFLGKRPWFAGEKITCLDFLAYDILDLHCIFEPKSLDAFPNLKEFMARFEGLKKISAYMKSSRFLPGPLFLKIAFWGNK